MAIGRSLTKKPSRYSFSTSGTDPQTKRSSISKIQISAPLELISTTNMISFTSPSLRSSISTSSSSNTLTSSPPSSPSTSASSGSDSEVSSPDEPSPPPNHLSMYFTTGPTPTVLARSKSRRSTSPTPPVPMVSGLNLTRTPSHSSTRSQKMHSRGVRASNPFGAELAKVAEMAEDIGVHIRDAEEEFMFQRGLQKFSADDYAVEIGGVFGDALPNLGAEWI